MPRDDDMDYTVVGLLVLEKFGTDFTPQEVGLTWLDRLPYNLLYTAERIAYRNLVNGVQPPATALTNNPFREWIGAQIRADIWGYIMPGRPEQAAELAFRDACISHTKNGIYGAMFIAALLAASYVVSETEQLVQIALSEIPANCRLASGIRDTVLWSKEDADWKQTWQKINAHYGHYADVHTIKNALLVVMGLLQGGGDFEQTIVTTVQGGWDTDCTTASAGSVMGLILGAKALPEKWVGVFNDEIESAVRGEQSNRLTTLAKRTHTIAADVLAENVKI
jgi:ADP-ribosylglycohydrolase|tara:strand:- start:100 stop:939 length:840 start_codon:yes stop_codon:yes gene_type:complete